MSATREELEAKITACDTAVRVKRAEAEGSREKLVTIIAQRLQEWLPQAVEQCVTSEYTVTQGLGNRLVELKREIEALRDHLPTKVPEWLGDPLWPHREASRKPDNAILSQWRRYQNVSAMVSGNPVIKAKLDNTLIKHLTSLLQRYGYRSQTQEMFWRQDLIESFNRYVDQLTEYLGSLQALDAFQEALARHEAATLWSKA